MDWDLTGRKGALFAWVALTLALAASIAFAQGLPEPSFGVQIGGLRTVPKGAKVTIYVKGGFKFSGKAMFKKQDGWSLGLKDGDTWRFVSEAEIVCVEVERVGK